MVIAVPTPLVVQGDDEQIGAFEIFQEGLGVRGQGIRDQGIRTQGSGKPDPLSPDSLSP
jgi:hypothetical protein